MADTKINPESVKAGAGTMEFSAESQRQRWVKYGLNVALTILIVVALASFLTYIAQSKNLRKDTTAGGSYSLKPQTIALVENLDSRMRLQKVQTIIDVELPKVIGKLQGLTEAAPTVPPAPSTDPAAQPNPSGKLVPGAQMFRDRGFSRVTHARVLGGLMAIHHAVRD